MNTGPVIAMILIALIIVTGVVRSCFGYWVVRKDAEDEWLEFNKKKPQQAKKTTHEKFTAAYRAAHNPRGLAYSTAALTLAVLVTPLALMLLTLFYSTVIVQEFDPNAPAAETLAEEVQRQFRRDGPLVYSFFIFFGLIASWGAVAFTVARLYHRTDDDQAEENLRLSRGDQPLGKVKIKRKRPKWSPLVQTDDGLSLAKPLNTNKQQTDDEKA